jgi:A/G-specific adenine glycosylase
LLLTGSASRITEQLLAWYNRQGRALPWRETHDPYHIWISEIMLQQTQVDTVIPYFHRFLKQFPTVESLARSNLHDVMMVWENLGYYARAVNMHEAAQIISHDFAGNMPDTWDALIQLPGIGPYTAGAILSIAFEKRIPAVDGNARRVLSRLFAVEDPVDRPRTQRGLYRLAEKLIPLDSPGNFNQALMDLGSLICTSKNPSCSICPVLNHCRAFELALQHHLPVAGKRSSLPHKNAAAAILRDSQNRVLIVQRPAKGLLGSLWKFPGGFLHEGEALPDGLQRTVKEELGLEIQVLDLISSVKHAYTHFRMTLHIFHCIHNGAEPFASPCQNQQWATPDDFAKLPFSRADRKVIAAISHEHTL